MKTVIYLRKSRGDAELESKNEGETLQKHKKILLKFAKEKNLNIIKIFEEIVSGESIIHRPEMLELLKEVENNTYEAVLVMDIDRLGRGNMQEQGLILETLKKANTKIITPRKTYDLNNDFDEEYSEFEAFMSRKELKIINRRLQRGRLRSVEEGNYIGTNAPFGYIKNNGTLLPHPEQAHIIQYIFENYTQGRIGAGIIAKKLNEMNVKTSTGIRWTLNAVINIINNPIYTGKICWNRRITEKSKDPKKRRIVEKRAPEEWLLYKGRHQAIISEETYKLAIKIKEARSITRNPDKRPLVNPLAGLVVCGKCGAKMSRRPYKYQKAHFMCPEVNCKCKSSRFDYVENKILEIIRDWLEQYEAEKSEKQIKQESLHIELYNHNIKNLEKELETLSKQKNQLHDLLEQGVYDVNTFLERTSNLTQRIDNVTQSIELQQKYIIKESKEKNTKLQIDAYRYTLEIYNKLENASEKNLLLKSIIDKIIYTKENNQKNNNFELIILPKSLK